MVINEMGMANGRDTETIRQRSGPVFSAYGDPPEARSDRGKVGKSQNGSGKAHAAPGIASHGGWPGAPASSPSANHNRSFEGSKSFYAALTFAIVCFGLLLFNAGREWAEDQNDLFSDPVVCYAPPDWIRCP